MEPKEQADSNIRNKEDLLEIFHESMKPSSEFRIGAEAEKFGVFRESKKPIQYEDASSSGIVNILHELSEKFGWVKDLEHERSPLIALKRGMGSITLEPGAQLELSGAPHENLHDVNFEMNIHLDELEQISKPLGIEWLGVGFHPFSKIEELSWVPKPRYGIMKTYLPTRGIQGLNMMLRTSTVQANFDYSSEEFAMRCLNVGLRLSPLVTAIFANSPFVEGKRWGGKSYRAKVWLDVDGSRQGLLPELMVKGKKFSDYVEWALDAPMFLIKRGDQIIENTNQTFREFLKVGKGGLKATQSDWQMHINSMFPEVRLKRTIEMRCADSLMQAIPRPSKVRREGAACLRRSNSAC